MRNILGIIWLVILIFVIIDIIKRPMDMGKKILWIILILFLPLLGVILYFLLGRK